VTEAVTTKLRRPCANCPWRVDAPREYWDPQHFVDIWRNCQDDGPHIMLCHFQPALSRLLSRKAIAKRKPSSGQPLETTPNDLPQEARGEIPCQGWIRVMGFDAIGVRILAMRGQITFEEIEDRAGPKLFSSFTAMMRANKIKLPKRSKQRP
jgi:hypothetical protein